MNAMALTEHQTHREAEEAPIRLSVVRTVALCMVGVFVFLLTLHVDAYGWDAAGCGVFIVLALLSFAAAAWPKRTASQFGPRRD